MAKNEYFDLLRRWCDGLIEHQIRHPNKVMDGALFCPACHISHGRIQDMMYPMVYVYSVTGDKKYYDAGMAAFRWVERNLSRRDGCVDNDKGARWLGITVFAQTSLGHAVMTLKDAFTKEDYDEVYAAFVRESDGLYNGFSGENFNPNINYFYGCAAAMAFAYKITGKKKYLSLCRKMIDKFKPLITDEYIISGETHNFAVFSPKGNSPVDIGYNMEESIPLLAMTAHLLEDEELTQLAVKIALTHAEFVIPDGGIDNSFGCRSNKWTYWGSRTSDGLAEGFIYLLPYDKSGVLSDVIYANFKMLESCTHGNMLYGGLDYFDHGELPCVHHAFTHVKALAALCQSGYTHKVKKVKDAENNPILKNSVVPMLPRNYEYGLKHFKSVDATLISFGNWRATVSGNDAYDVPFAKAVTSGGSLTLLWHPETGALCCATPDVFERIEPTNMQFLNDSLEKEYSLTPRLYAGKYSSVYALDAVITSQQTESAVTVTAKGMLKNVGGEELAPYTIVYTFRDNQLDIDVTCPRDGVRYTLPLGAPHGDKVTFGDLEYVFDKPSCRMVLVSDTPLTNRAEENGGYALHLVAGLRAVYPETLITNGKAHLRLTIFKK